MSDQAIDKIQKPRNKYFAAILSFALPGLGHGYLGFRKIGQRFLIFYLVGELLMGGLILTTQNLRPGSWLAIMTGYLVAIILFRVYNLVDILRRARCAKSFPSSKFPPMTYAFTLLLYFLIHGSFEKIVEGKADYKHFTIPGRSMAPTFYKRETFLAQKVRNPNFSRGDVVIIEREDTQTGAPNVYVKRIAAVEGDRITEEHGLIFVNGESIKINHPNNGMALDFWSHPEAPGNRSLVNTIQSKSGYEIPLDHVFLIGDNYTDSLDSRFWGALPESNILGKAVYRVVGRTSKGDFSFDRSLMALEQ